MGTLLVGKRQGVADACAGGRVLAAEEPAPSDRCCVICAEHDFICNASHWFATTLCGYAVDSRLTLIEKAGKAAPMPWLGRDAVDNAMTACGFTCPERRSKPSSHWRARDGDAEGEVRGGGLTFGREQQQDDSQHQDTSHRGRVHLLTRNSIFQPYCWSMIEDIRLQLPRTLGMIVYRACGARASQRFSWGSSAAVVA